MWGTDMVAHACAARTCLPGRVSWCVSTCAASTVHPCHARDLGQQGTQRGLALPILSGALGRVGALLGMGGPRVQAEGLLVSCAPGEGMGLG